MLRESVLFIFLYKQLHSANISAPANAGQQGVRKGDNCFLMW